LDGAYLDNIQVNRRRSSAINENADGGYLTVEFAAVDQLLASKNNGYLDCVQFLHFALYLHHHI